MQAKINAEQTIYFDSQDFEGASNVDYIVKGKTALDAEDNPVIGALQFDGNTQPSDVVINKTFYSNSPNTLQVGTFNVQTASATVPSNVAKGSIYYNNSPTTPVVGTLEFTGSAQPSDVEKGKTFYNTDIHRYQTGTLSFEASNTDGSDVVSGKTYYNNNLRQLNVGTLTFSGNAQPSDVEAGFQFYNNDLLTKRTGTLTLNSQQMSGSAIAANILEGKTAHTTQLRTTITGTMRNNGSVNKSLNSGESYTIPSGYHDGTGIVKENSPKDQTYITTNAAVANQIWSGMTAYVNGNLLVGTGTPQNVQGTSGGGNSGGIPNRGSISVHWKYPVSGFYTGVCVLGSTSNWPTSNDPASSPQKLYMGPGVKLSVDGWYGMEIPNLPRFTTYYFNVYPYVVINGTTYWYGVPTPTKAGPYSSGCFQYGCSDCDPDCGDCGLCVGYCQTC